MLLPPLNELYSRLVQIRTSADTQHAVCTTSILITWVLITIKLIFHFKNSISAATQSLCELDNHLTEHSVQAYRSYQFTTIPSTRLSQPQQDKSAVLRASGMQTWGRGKGSEPVLRRGALLFCQSVSGLGTSKIIYSFLFAMLSSKSLELATVQSGQWTAQFTTCEQGCHVAWRKEKKHFPGLQTAWQCQHGAYEKSGNVAITVAAHWDDGMVKTSCFGSRQIHFAQIAYCSQPTINTQDTDGQ